MADEGLRWQVRAGVSGDYAEYVRLFEMVGAPGPVKTLPEFQDLAVSTMHVAEVAGEVGPGGGPRLAGYILWDYLDEGAVAAIRNVVVDSAFRRQGLGSALMSAVVSRLPSSTLSWRLYVESSNTPAIKLYERWGLRAKDRMRLLSVSETVLSKAPVEDLQDSVVEVPSNDVRIEIERAFGLATGRLSRDDAQVWALRKEDGSWSGCAAYNPTLKTFRTRGGLPAATKLLLGSRKAWPEDEKTAVHVFLEEDDMLTTALLDIGAEVVLSCILMTGDVPRDK